MKKRYYLGCSRCGKRMRRFSEDPNADHRYYYCINCGSRVTYVITLNAVSDDWPRSVLEDAVKKGAFTRAGRVLA